MTDNRESIVKEKHKPLKIVLILLLLLTKSCSLWIIKVELNPDLIYPYLLFLNTKQCLFPWSFYRNFFEIQL